MQELLSKKNHDSLLPIKKKILCGGNNFDNYGVIEVMALDKTLLSVNLQRFR